MASSHKKSKKKIRADRKKDQRRKQQIRTIMILGLLVLVGLGYTFYPRQEAPGVTTTRLEDQPSLGSADAKVVLTEFGDFTCSACKSWHQAGIVNELLAYYGNDLRVEWRDFPVITADSPKAAQAGQCAHDQGLFWEYLDRVYSEPGSSYTNAGEDNLGRYAADVNLDMETFNNCLNSDQHQNTVSYDLEAGRDLRLPGTPAFLVNGQPIIGANPQLLAQAIDEALAGK
jgi:protein-disulfide isomerase